jgi:8-oxo-dGTP diphosphatase
MPIEEDRPQGRFSLRLRLEYTGPMEHDHLSSALSDPVRTVLEIVSGIRPFDDLEKEHIRETLEWIRSGRQIFRIQKPDTPPKHLVSYFVLFDEERRKVLLADHKKALLWLPAGGHMDVDEHPRTTVERECMEELGIPADFWRDEPLFLTSTVTVGAIGAGHTDVTLWYVLRGDSEQVLRFDEGEFNGIRWFDLSEIPFDRADPHMERFVEKLRGLLQ